MKAKPYRWINGAYVECPPAEVTHLMLNLPGPYSRRMLPVMIGGRREGTPNWTWNGSTESPTLKPSILVKGTVPLTDEEADRIHAGEKFTPVPCICHTFVNDGRVQFLDDCTHEFAGQTLDLLEVD
jgi:hypothetical protein